MTSVGEGLAETRSRIDRAARAANRDPAEITLVAVSKEVGPDAVLDAMAAGQRDFGENRAQELTAKVGALARTVERTFDAAGAVQPVWHFIGRLQRNKIKAVAPVVALWHSVDRVEIGEAIARHAPGARVLVQLNVGAEVQKGGCAPADAERVVSALRDLGLAVEGLMTVPPHVGDPRPAFAMLRELASGLGLGTLSMGMSGDFEAAIAEGATHVRVGTAIFGARP